MQREIFTPEHDAFRDMVRTFITKEIAPYHEQWERDGMVSRDVWLAAGRAGLLGIHIDEKYGGGGDPDYRYYVILNEELARAGATGPMFQLHNDMIGPYLDRLCTPEQRERWLPGYCSGELIAAIAMTEPGAGSDLQGIRSTAVRSGDHYLLNGQKTFISNGQLGDIVIVVARTDPEAGHRGISLLVVERGMPGFDRGRNLDKLGMHAQDTSELFFTDVRVPAENLLGAEGGGFVALMQNLPRERVTIGVTALAIAEKAFEDTLAYCKQRQAFGQPIGMFQHLKFVAGRDGHRTGHRARVHRPRDHRALRGPADQRRGGHGQVVEHRTLQPGHRPLRATARRVRLHARVPGRPRLGGRPRPVDLRRHHRDPEGNHRPRPRPVALTRYFIDPVLPAPDPKLDRMLEPALSRKSVSGSAGRPCSRCARRL